MPNGKATSIRVDPETHKRLHDLAKQIGVSQVAVVKRLVFATPAEYVEFERRRITAGTTPAATDEESSPAATNDS